jgi:hypothetical protein
MVQQKMVSAWDIALSVEMRLHLVSLRLVQLLMVYQCLQLHIEPQFPRLAALQLESLVEAVSLFVHVWS